MQGSEQLDWLIQTKLQPPLPRSDVITRPYLLAALRDGLASHRLTLLSAPAGYGKTTLLAAYCAEEQRSRGESLPCSPAPLPPHSPAQIAWLTLDEGDDDPTLFLAYLVAALRRLNSACGVTAQTLLADLPNPGAQAQRVVGVLLNDVLETLPDPFALVLDDLHRVAGSAAYVALDYLLEHLPPQMRLVIGARHDPPLALARLRARGELAELRAPDLSFTPDETAAFLNEQLRLDLSPGDLAALHSRTEGWPASLRLLAGSLARIAAPADRTAFIAHLAQTDRHVFDFLAEEVLNQQEPAVRAFLLETSILPELTPALCQAVADRRDAHAILEELYLRNLFVVAVDPTHTAFRYHALFAEFLRQRLAQETPQQMADLHRRAAEAQDQPRQAIHHYLAAGMWEQAAKTIEAVGEQLFHQGLLDTLTGWIRALPPQLLDAHPLLTWYLGNSALLKGEFEASRPLLEQALQRFGAAGDEEKQGAILANLASSAFLDADFERARALIRRALAYPVPRSTLVQLLMGRAWLGLFEQDWAQTSADFETALAVTLESDDPLAWLMMAFNLKPDFAVLPGGLERIERFCRQATTRAGEPIGPVQLVVEELMTFIHLWRGRLEQAIQAGERALAIKGQVDGFAFLGGDAVAYVAVAHAARGDYAAADRNFALLIEQIEQVALNQATQGVAFYLLGRTRWLQGRLEEARQLYARMCAAESDRELPVAPALRAMMRGLLELADRRYAAAEGSFHQATALERQTPTVAIVGSARLLLARLYVEMKRPDKALAELTPVLAECERENTPGLILKEGHIVVPVLRLAVERSVHAPFAARLLELLGATGEPRPVPVPGTGETLTPREVEVLRLIVAGAANRVIAEQLVVSESTVKTHTYHIFQKLGVSSRTQAAARARDLRLV